VFSLRITNQTKLYAIVGDPVEHSLSPAMQNAAFQASNFNAIYVALKVTSSMLNKAVEGFKAINLVGFNVTIPHKIAVIKHLDQLNLSAEEIGAVNTVVHSDGKLIGYNTDGPGALAALREANVDPRGMSVVILGAGGAARALAYSLAPTAERLTILNRTAKKASQLAREVERAKGKHVVWGGLESKNLQRELTASNLLVNATSLGMYPHYDESPVKAEFLHGSLIVFDIIYNPQRTRLIHEAEMVGAKTVGGMMMLVYQGALAFELWTGKKAPVEEMVRVLKEQLKVV
jgi:shikimate dehydrogenase